MKTINNFQIINKNVLLRVDLNVPVKGGIVIDKTRIYSIQSSVNQLRLNNNKIFTLFFFNDCLTCFKDFKFVLIIG